ncbi:MAG: carbamoyltransferase C-terminal domain-containing protein [Enhygromyxa sp.]
MIDRPNVLAVCCTGHGAGLAFASARHGVRAMTLERFTGQRNALLLSRRELAAARSGHDPLGIWGLFGLCYGQFPPAFAYEDVIEPWTEALLDGLPVGPAQIDLLVGPADQFALDAALQARQAEWFPNARLRLFAEHHEAHRFQAFLPSPFRDAAVLTVDACGEALGRLDGAKLAMTLSHAEDPGRFEVFAEHQFPSSSPGWFYGRMTLELGFFVNEEGKTMGLAPYGRDRYARFLRTQLELHEDGSFGFARGFDLDAWLETLGGPRQRDQPIDAHHEDLAYAAQAVLEDIIDNAVAALAQRSPSENLCIAGGVGLNSVANQKSFARARFRRIYICPNAGDTGHALGCALAAAGFDANAQLSRRLCPAGLRDDYLGPPYPEARLAAAISEAGLTAERCDDRQQRARTAARWIADGNIVAVFHGRSEHGPRALGHRSILADPRDPGMADHLNRKVKHREPFRPFAPAVLAEAAPHWFTGDSHDPFMLRVVEVLDHQRARVPAITHVDGSARVQAVHREDSPELYALIEAFAELTRVPLVLNTSFNVAGQPIVETPEDAVACFLATEIDALVLGPYLVPQSSD